MNSSIEYVYLSFAKSECELAEKAMEDLDAAAAMTTKDDPIMCAISFVNHTAAVSRMFWSPDARPPEDWPGLKRHQRKIARAAYERCVYLRAMLQLPADNHELQQRNLRNCFEHFDRRLDDWARSVAAAVIVKSVVGSAPAIGGNVVKDAHIIHRYDPTTRDYYFRGQRHELNILLAGVKDIHERVSNRLSGLASSKMPSGTVILMAQFLQLPA